MNCSECPMMRRMMSIIEANRKMRINRKCEDITNKIDDDAIGFKISTEVALYYSQYFFGTADAISFGNNKIIIYDFKTEQFGHVEQLKIYAALFCLEYQIKPGDTQMELRLYKGDEVIVYEPTAEDILAIMDKIMTLNKALCMMEDEGNE